MSESNSLNDSVRTHIREYFAAHEGGKPSSGLYSRVIEEIEKTLIMETLQATRGNQLKAAEILGINRNTLRRKMEKSGLTPRQRRARLRRRSED